MVFVCINTIDCKYIEDKCLFTLGRLSPIVTARVPNGELVTKLRKKNP